jgi:protein-S-isoprenylcysteine O-methyltransferase Ste14/predicted DCC family thiol-disulfide oxidoreductase YuxK
VSRSGAIQLACLYGPLLCAGLLGWWTRPGKWQVVGLLFSLAWIGALLPWCDSLARAAGLWEYHSTAPALAGMPLALYFGWIIAWGIFAPLLAHALSGRWWLTAAVLLALDLRVMPELSPVLKLHSFWWIGDLGIIACLLIPSLMMSKWTAARTRLGLRCGILALAFGGIFLGIPVLVVCGDLAKFVSRWHALPGFLQVTFLTAGFTFSVPGLTALRDLALSGGGTPVPLDPPQRLVTHGIYAFVRNPMQLSMTGLLVLESLFLGSFWPAVLAFIGIVFSEGFARWSENQDMRDRFGADWSRYHRAVRPWWPRWNPRIGESCELWLDGNCGPCTELAQWFHRHHPQQLDLRDANEWPGSPLVRVTWFHPPSGRCESGVRAIAMALQHLPLPWAAVGWTAGLPGISHILQICFDAAGAGRRQNLIQ